jgi:hypothetical protein
MGLAVILSDGDVVFQSLKINRSGLADAVSDRVLIYVHKEQELEDVEQRYLAEHYVIADDKLRFLPPSKSSGTRVSPSFSLGKASMPPIRKSSPVIRRPISGIARIGDLLKYKPPQLVEPKR